jgi:2-haloacid dehalogenase
MAKRRVRVAALDVNETLSDLTPLGERIAGLGAPSWLLDVWFASVLRDGFALSLHADFDTFGALGQDVLAGLLARHGVEDPDAGAAHVLEGFDELDLHPDVPDGIRALHEHGIRVVTLTNGNAALTDRLLERAGLLGVVERRLSVDSVRRWKPAAAPYLFAASVCGVDPGRLALVAVHPWDVDGAMRTGLVGAFLARGGVRYPASFLPADVTAPTLPELAAALAALPMS